MKNKKNIFSIKLETEPDFLGRTTKVKMLGVNQLFQPSRNGKGLDLTPEGRKYKKFLESKVKVIKQNLGLDKPLDEPIMIYVKIYHWVQLTKGGEKDKRFIRDVDNLFKPLQDAFQGENGIWKDDKSIRFVAGNIKENEREIDEFEISILPLEKKTINQLEKIFF